MASEQVFNIKLVGEIEKYPVLYNYTLKDYSRKDITEKAWNEVAEQVGMAVPECKERWKNVRAVYVRHMKPGPSGSGSKNKKPYYLAEAMQFTLPFIKALCRSSGNLPEVPQRERCLDIDDSDNESSVVVQNSVSPGSFEPSQPPPPPLPPTPPPVKPQQPGRSSERHTEPASKNLKKRAVRNDAVDNTLIEYFQAKKAKLSTTTQGDTSNNPRSEALKMFLLSMLPDLESMTDIQVRQFKIKCLETIDEILLPPPHLSSNPASTTSLPSFSPSSY
ncbi:uncharacterized protein [Anabrus simplex]|uniref:uncharacterized protein n=1 Tax=Anabrus simplex TaxID=316456 RepID=UPI0035A325A3